MDAFHMDEKFLYRLLRIKCDRGTGDYVLQEMEEVLGECQPDAEQVRAYLQAPGKPTTLNIPQQIVAMDKLLECAEWVSPLHRPSLPRGPERDISPSSGGPGSGG